MQSIKQTINLNIWENNFMGNEWEGWMKIFRIKYLSVMDGFYEILFSSPLSNEWRKISLMFEVSVVLGGQHDGMMAWWVSGTVWTMRVSVTWDTASQPANCLAWADHHHRWGGRRRGVLVLVLVLSCPLSWLEEAEAMGRCDRALVRPGREWWRDSHILTHSQSVVSQYHPPS